MAQLLQYTVARITSLISDASIDPDEDLCVGYEENDLFKCKFNLFNERDFPLECFRYLIKSIYV